MRERKKRRAVVVGFDYHARYLARLLTEYAEDWQAEHFPTTRLGMLRALSALRKADVLISFGAPAPSATLAELAEARHLPVVIIWAGTDVQKATSDPFDLVVQRHRGFINVAVAEWLVDELRLLGVSAQYLPVGSVDVSLPVCGFPSAFRVLTYLPEPRREFYGESRVYAIAAQLPEIEFVVIGAGAKSRNAPRNVTFHGYDRDVTAVIDASTVFLRLPEHDGKSMLVLEAMARARHVVWTYECPGVRTVKDIDEAREAIREMWDLRRREMLELNFLGRSYVETHFSRPLIARSVERYLNTVAPPGPIRQQPKARGVAISGLDLFSAEVAEQVERRHPEWRPCILRTGSRLEVLMALINLARSDVWYSIGGPTSDRLLHQFARLMRTPRVVHWVGSDIERLRASEALRRSLLSPSIHHLTEIEWTAEELAELGLQSEIVPLPLRHRSGGVKALPERFTMLLYVPKSRPQFYGQGEFEELLKPFAGEDIRVFVVGGGDVKAPPGIELINLGWRGQLQEIYEQSTLLIRLTPRDGLSLMVLEALSFGRHVMWSKPFPYVTHVRGRDDLTNGVTSLLERHREGRLFPQYVAAEMIAKRYSDESAVTKLLDAWDRARNAARSAPPALMTPRGETATTQI